MKYGICNLSVVPCRAEPSDKSEMVTQLLFGETIKVYEESKGNWKRIKTAFDDYNCWIDQKQFIEISKKEFEQLNAALSPVSTSVVEVIKGSSSLIPIVIGSSLPNLKNKEITFGDHTYTYEGPSVSNSAPAKKEALVENAFIYLDTPYLWGGRSPFGIDCSGYTQLVYKLNGIQLPRDASKQAEIGQTLSFIEEAENGDLAFFDNEEGDIIHVGILLTNNRIIHASGKVRMDKIDHQGIFNVDTGKYSHRLRLIKRII